RDYKVTGVQTCALPILAEGVHRHFRLLLRLPDSDVQGAALDFFLADHDDVGDPLLFRVPDLLSEGIVRVVEVGADALEAGQEGRSEERRVGKRQEEVYA